MLQISEQEIFASISNVIGNLIFLTTYPLWNTRSFNFTPYNNMVGCLSINNADIWATFGSNFDLNTQINIKQNTSTGNFDICVFDLQMAQFNLTFDYIADFGIANIPIYGDGSYRGHVTDVNTTFCWLLSAEGDKVLDFDISVLFQHQPVSLTGVFNNEELDSVIEAFLTQVHRFLAMWNNYEQDCCRKCILNPIFLFLINYITYDTINNEFAFPEEECQCLMGLQSSFIEDLLLNPPIGMSTWVQETIDLFGIK
ncbi:uncharacterized protein [Euwallacea similis]|uniref:uncharacterized protein isoform X2 n=1 Tax=Euwallacea similis TaxID=1736056 RepID=UPI003450A952